MSLPGSGATACTTGCKIFCLRRKEARPEQIADSGPPLNCLTRNGPAGGNASAELFDRHEAVLPHRRLTVHLEV